MASTGVNQDPIAAVQRALAAHLNTALPAQFAAQGYQITADLAQRVQDGWADTEWEILEPDGSASPKQAVVTITTPAGGDVAYHYPQALSQTNAITGPNTEVLYSIGRIELDLQIDAWAKSRAEREALAAAIRLSMRVSVPFGSQLFLALPEYHGIQATLALKGTGYQNDTGSMVGGAWWRYTAIATAQFDECIRVTMARLRELYVNHFIPYDDSTAETKRIF